MNILLQPMRASYDCFLAALVSMVGQPYEEVWPGWFQDEIKEKEGTFGENIDKAFLLAGLQKDRHYWFIALPNHISLDTIRALLQGRRALLQVRSLTRANGWHIIAWTGQEVFDPQKFPKYTELEMCSPANIWIFDEMTEVTITEAQPTT